MIQPQTYLTIADNTGAKKLMCIRILGNNNISHISIFSIIHKDLSTKFFVYDYKCYRF